eukprot:365573-Chlamydomonas_euryale.AAC.20
MVVKGKEGEGGCLRQDPSLWMDQCPRVRGGASSEEGANVQDVGLWDVGHAQLHKREARQHECSAHVHAAAFAEAP